MQFSATATPLHEIVSWRDLYRREMQCQVVHASLYSYGNWVQSYLLKKGDTAVGYGSIVVGGRWRGTRTVFEFYVEPQYRSHVFDLFTEFVSAAGATAFEIQSNDILLNRLLPAWCAEPTIEGMIFQDKQATALPGAGTIIHRIFPDDIHKVFAHREKPVGDWVLEFDNRIVATGGMANYYNEPYKEIYVEVVAAYRRRGLGSYLVQELKRLCYDSGDIPCARCKPDNEAALKTILKTGFVTSAQILSGALSPRSVSRPQFSLASDD